MKRIIALALCLSFINNFPAFGQSEVTHSVTSAPQGYINITKNNISSKNNIDEYLYTIKNNCSSSIRILRILDNHDQYIKVYSSHHIKSPIKRAFDSNSIFIALPILMIINLSDYPDDKNFKSRIKNFIYATTGFVTLPLGLGVGAVGTLITYPYFKIQDLNESIKDYNATNKAELDLSKFIIMVFYPIKIDPGQKIQLLIVPYKSPTKELQFQIQDIKTGKGFNIIK